MENSSRDFTAAPLQNSCPKKGTAFVHLTSVSIPEIPCGMGQVLHTDVGWSCTGNNSVSAGCSHFHALPMLEAVAAVAA